MGPAIQLHTVLISPTQVLYRCDREPCGHCAQGGGGMEFGQLPQEELPAVAAYVQQQRLAVGAPPDDETDAEEEEEEGTGEEFDAAGSAPASGRDGASGGSGDADESDDEVCTGSLISHTSCSAGRTLRLVSTLSG